jgi:hypothetical protein
MAIYGVTIKGRTKRILIREDSQAKAVAHFASAKALTAEEMQDALDSGEAVWKPGTDLPADAEPEKKSLDELDPPPNDGQVAEGAGEAGKPPKPGKPGAAE